MGYFEDAFRESGGKEPDAGELSQHESFAAIALALSAADSSVNDLEIENLVTYLRRMHLFRDYETGHFVQLFDRLVRRLRAAGPKGLIDAARANLPRDLRETAFALSVDVALADGAIDAAEKGLIGELRRVLEIPEDLALKIVDVMIIKNRG